MCCLYKLSSSLSVLAYNLCFCVIVSVSEEDLDEMETTEADGELQIVTECWIEPQHGTSINNSPERQHWDGLTYKDIAKAVSSFIYLDMASTTTNHNSTSFFY